MKLTISILIAAFVQLTLAGGPSGPCTSTFVLRNLGNGQYIKTLCFVNLNFVQPAEVQYCRRNGMELYNVESIGDRQAMAAYIKNNHPADFTFYLDTVRTNGMWSPPLNSAVTPITDRGERCIFIKNDATFVTADCTFAYTFVCQYQAP